MSTEVLVILEGELRKVIQGLKDIQQEMGSESSSLLETVESLFPGEMDPDNPGAAAYIKATRLLAGRVRGVGARFKVLAPEKARGYPRGAC